MKKILIIAAALLSLSACVKDEIFKGPSSIDKVVFTPEAPTSLSDVTVTATVSGLQKARRSGGCPTTWQNLSQNSHLRAASPSAPGLS